MGKLVCKCGYVFDLTTAPEAHMWIAIKDADLESLRVAEFEAERLGVDYGKNKDYVTQLDQLIGEMRTVLYNCPNCTRIIWYRGRDGEYEVFTQEL